MAPTVRLLPTRAPKPLEEVAARPRDVAEEVRGEVAERPEPREDGEQRRGDAPRAEEAKVEEVDAELPHQGVVRRAPRARPAPADGGDARDDARDVEEADELLEVLPAASRRGAERGLRRRRLCQGAFGNGSACHYRSRRSTEQAISSNTVRPIA